MNNFLHYAPAFDTKQAASFLGLSVSCLNHWRIQDRGPKFIRLGDGPKPRIRYRIRDLENYANGD